MKKRKAATEARLPGFQPGDSVVLVSTGECGVVVSSWQDGKSELRDYYVAFFGKSFPAPLRKPRKIPYVLCYAESSLRLATVGSGGGI